MQKTKTLFRNILAALILLLSASAANAATFTVSNTNNTGAGSLRQAVTDSNNAAGSDTIVFDPAVFNTPQTITLASAIFVNQPAGVTLTITGPGANLLTISGNNAVAIFARVGLADALALSGMTLANSGTSAVSNAAGSLTVTDVNFVSNTGTFGGAINNGSTLTVTNCAFTNNVANGGGATGNGGGAIFSSTAAGVAVSITNSTFTGNAQTVQSANSGGAIRNRNGTMTITNSTFTNNTAAGSGGGAVSNSETMTISGSTFTDNSTTTDSQNDDGGAISNTGSGQMTISNSVITGNRALKDGGGIYHQPNAASGAFLTVNNSTVSNNIANFDGDTTGNGGGLFLTGTGSVNISNSTVSGNRSDAGATAASGNGGGIEIGGSGIPTTLTNVTISGNVAGRIGGGIRALGTSTAIVNIENSTIFNNAATFDGGGINRGGTTNPVNLRSTIVAVNYDAADGNSPDIFGTVNSNDYNLIGNTSGAMITGTTTNNITGVDPQLQPLANNGGATQTHALTPGSPAVDKGNSFGLTTDQRGINRITDDANIPNTGDASDIGAFELQTTTAAGVSVSGRVTAQRRGVARAVVYMTDQAGNTRTARTDRFGYYRFDEVETGQTYIFNVYSRQYQFEPQVVNITENFSELNFEAVRFTRY